MVFQKSRHFLLPRSICSCTSFKLHICDKCTTFKGYTHRMRWLTSDVTSTPCWVKAKNTLNAHKKLYSDHLLYLKENV